MEASGMRVLFAATISCALLLGSASGTTLDAQRPGIRAGRLLQTPDLGAHPVLFTDAKDQDVLTDEFVQRELQTEFSYSFEDDDDDDELVEVRERTTVTTYATAYDTRTTLPWGCIPGGCMAGLTRDQDMSDMSRWSCKEDLNGEQCVIFYDFEEPQDIVSIRVKFWKGDQRVRILKIVDSSGFYQIITSSGTATGFEEFELNTDETATISLEALGNDDDEWISITEVEFMVE